jgi:hypothetical protein
MRVVVLPRKDKEKDKPERNDQPLDLAADEILPEFGSSPLGSYLETSKGEVGSALGRKLKIAARVTQAAVQVRFVETEQIDAALAAVAAHDAENASRLAYELPAKPYGLDSRRCQTACQNRAPCQRAPCLCETQREGLRIAATLGSIATS